MAKYNTIGGIESAIMKKRSYKKNRYSHYNMSREDISYFSYLEHRMKWESKGYSLDPALSKEEYLEYAKLAKERGQKNIAREFAKQDRIYTKQEAYNLRDIMKDYGEEIDVKDVIGARSREDVFNWYMETAGKFWKTGSDRAKKHNRNLRNRFEAIYG